MYCRFICIVLTLKFCFIEYSGPKSTAAQNLVKMLQAQGVKIDGVGLQSHFTVGGTPDAQDLASNNAAFTDLGIDVAVTELDVRMTLPETDALLAQQKIDFNSVVSACNQTERCVGVTVWDYTDKVIFPIELSTRAINMKSIVFVGAEFISWTGRCVPVGCQPRQEACVRWNFGWVPIAARSKTRLRVDYLSYGSVM